MTASPRRPPRAPADVARRVRDTFDDMPPKVQRAARWLIDHGSEVAMLSMREQARHAGVSAPTMLRLGRALGYRDYAALRRPFQDGIARGPMPLGRRATALQSTAGSAHIDQLAAAIAKSQVDDIASVRSLNAPASIEAVVRAIAGARRVGFLGVRSSFSIAYHFRYAYNLIATNGVVLDGLGGIFLDQAEAFDRRDVMVAISQAPYSTPTVLALDAAKRRHVTIVALTDSTLSPLARRATHTLLFRTESLSFLPSMIAPLALVELLLARLAARGGRAVIDRLADVERRLDQSHAYWVEAHAKDAQ